MRDMLTGRLALVTGGGLDIILPVDRGYHGI